MTITYADEIEALNDLRRRLLEGAGVKAKLAMNAEETGYELRVGTCGSVITYDFACGFVEMNGGPTWPSAQGAADDLIMFEADHAEEVAMELARDEAVSRLIAGLRQRPITNAHLREALLAAFDAGVRLAAGSVNGGDPACPAPHTSK